MESVFTIPIILGVN